MSEVNLERALNDPADLFEDPDAVVHHPTLTREQKIQILNNWQLDASRLEASEGEGMGGEDAPMLHRVRLALAAQSSSEDHLILVRPCSSSRALIFSAARMAAWPARTAGRVAIIGASRGGWRPTRNTPRPANSAGPWPRR